MQVQAAQVEGELDPEPTEEALDVVGRLGKSIGHQVDAPPFQLSQRLRARLVAVRDAEPIAGAVVVGQPFPPAQLRWQVQHVPGALVSPAQLGADQYPAPQLKFRQPRLDGGEVLVVQLVDQHRAEPGEALGAEFGSVVVRELAELLEVLDEQFHYLHGSTEDDIRRVVEDDAEPHLPRRLEGVSGDGVHLANHVGLCQAVGEHPLAIDDWFGLTRAGEQHPAGDVAQNLVARRHCGEQRGQFEVLGELGFVGRERSVEIDVALGMQEKDLHRAMRLLNVS